MSKRVKLLQRAAALVIVVLVGGCSPGDSSQESSVEPPSVDVITLQTKPLALISELPGRIEPVRVAEVRARVAGIVLSREFDEGAYVESGQVLFKIDPAPFLAALSRAKGELAKADAEIYGTQTLVNRYATLVKIDAVSKQEFDSAQAALRSSQAARQSALADVQTAELNLNYATVKAPISGRVGRALVTEGALVGQGEATPMATIQQIDFVYADFKQTVAETRQLRQSFTQSGQATTDQPLQLWISVEGTDQQRHGELMFSDITVDRASEQISLRGKFANADGLLLPGMYVRVHVNNGSDSQALLVPQRAVQRNFDGDAYVVVIDKDDIAHARPVQTGSMQGADWHITDGLAAGERIVIHGAGKTKSGEKVSVTRSADSVATTAADSLRMTVN